MRKEAGMPVEGLRGAGWGVAASEAAKRRARACSAKTRWLVFVRLVDKSQGLETEPLAFDKP